MKLKIAISTDTCFVTLISGQQDQPRSENHFTMNVRDHDLNLMNILSILIIILRIYPEHDLVHFPTARLSYHVQKCDLILSMLLK